jgi:hypothetical protein
VLARIRGVLLADGGDGRKDAAGWID